MGGKALQQVAQGKCGSPIPEGVQGQLGWGMEQPGQWKMFLTMIGELEKRDL